MAALRALARGWNNDPSTLPFLKERTLSDEDDDVREVAVNEMQRRWNDDPEAIEIIPSYESAINHP